MKKLIHLVSQNFKSFVSTQNASIASRELKQHSKFTKTKFRKHDLLVAALRCFIFTVLIASNLIMQTKETNAANLKPLTANILSSVISFSDFFSIIAVLLIAALAFYLSFKPSDNKNKGKKIILKQLHYPDKYNRYQKHL